MEEGKERISRSWRKERMKGRFFRLALNSGGRNYYFIVRFDAV